MMKCVRGFFCAMAMILPGLSIAQLEVEAQSQGLELSMEQSVGSGSADKCQKVHITEDEMNSEHHSFIVKNVRSIKKKMSDNNCWAGRTVVKIKDKEVRVEIPAYVKVGDSVIVNKNNEFVAKKTETQ